MTETTACCGRCQTVQDTLIGVSVDGGPLHSTAPVLLICPECAASLARWLERDCRHGSASCRNAETGIRNEFSALISHSEFHVPHSREGLHQEQKPRFFRIVTIALITPASVLVAVPGCAACAGGVAPLTPIEPPMFMEPVVASTLAESLYK